MPRPRRKSHLAHRRSAAAESTRRHCRFCGESACTVAVAVAASSSGAAAGEEGVQTTPTLGVFPTKCCRPPPRPISHFLSASVFLKRQKQGPGRGEAGPRSRRTGGGGHKPSLPPVLTGATRRQRGTDQRERLRSSRPSGATDTVYRVRGPGGWDGQVGLQSLQTHCAPKKPVTASELTSQEVQIPVSTPYFAVPVHRECTPQARKPCSELLSGTWLLRPGRSTLSPDRQVQ